MAGFLESGCGLIVGLVRPDGVPFPFRAWGLDVLDPSAGTIRVLVGAGELARFGADRDDLAGAAIAVTGSDVRTLHTVQVKGTLDAVADVTADELKRARRHTERVLRRDRRARPDLREALERMVPVDYVALALTVTEAYDQTPGPGAGARMSVQS